MVVRGLGTGLVVRDLGEAEGSVVVIRVVREGFVGDQGKKKIAVLEGRKEGAAGCSSGGVCSLRNGEC